MKIDKDDPSLNQPQKFIGKTFDQKKANELSNLHIEWRNSFWEAQNSYLDMSVFMQQSIYEIYSQTHLG